MCCSLACHFETLDFCPCIPDRVHAYSVLLLNLLLLLDPVGMPTSTACACPRRDLSCAFCHCQHGASTSAVEPKQGESVENLNLSITSKNKIALGNVRARRDDQHVR